MHPFAPKRPEAPFFHSIASVDEWCKDVRDVTQPLVGLASFFDPSIDKALQDATWNQEEVDDFFSDPEWLQLAINKIWALAAPGQEPVRASEIVTKQETDRMAHAHRAPPRRTPANTLDSIQRASDTLSHVERVEALLRERERFLQRRRDGRIAFVATAGAFVAFVFGIILPLFTPEGGVLTFLYVLVPVTFYLISFGYLLWTLGRKSQRARHMQRRLRGRAF